MPATLLVATVTVNRYASTMNANNRALLTPREVAARFHVGSATVIRWAKAGKLPYARTPTGRFRFRESDVAAFTQVTELSEFSSLTDD
jgi:excisionase family DNA binding protein